MPRLSPRASTVSTRAMATLSSTAPEGSRSPILITSACESPDPEGTSRLSGAAYFGSCINPVAMMYTGYTDNFTQTNFSPIVDMQFTSLAGFVNDPWKLHRLTLMLGARVEHLGPWFDRHGNGLATFSPSLYASECSNANASAGPLRFSATAAARPTRDHMERTEFGDLELGE